MKKKLYVALSGSMAILLPMIAYGTQNWDQLISFVLSYLKLSLFVSFLYELTYRFFLSHPFKGINFDSCRITWGYTYVSIVLA